LRISLARLIPQRRFDSCVDVVAFRGIHVAGYLFVSPRPAADLGRVLAVLVDVLLMIDQGIPDRLLGVGRARAQLRQPIDHVSHEVESIQIVEHAHVEWRSRGPFFLVAAHVQIVVIGAPVGQAMDEPGVAVKREDDRLVLGEQSIEVLVAQAV
jgi:hypothetical protein